MHLYFMYQILNKIELNRKKTYKVKEYFYVNIGLNIYVNNARIYIYIYITEPSEGQEKETSY